MKEFNELSELEQFALLAKTEKNIILLTQPVFVHEGKAYQVDFYNYEKFDDFINAVKSATEKRCTFIHVIITKKLL